MPGPMRILAADGEPNGIEYCIAGCSPAFSPDIVHGDEGRSPKMDQQTRIKRLEWWNRLWMLGVVSLLFWGFTSRISPARDEVHGILRTERLEIVGERGQPAAVLGFDEQGSSGLFIHDPGGSMRVALAHDSQGSALFLRDSEGVIRVGVAQFADGGGGVALHGPSSQGAAVLYFKETGSLSFYDATGKATYRVPETAGE